MANWLCLEKTKRYKKMKTMNYLQTLLVNVFIFRPWYLLLLDTAHVINLIELAVTMIQGDPLIHPNCGKVFTYCLGMGHDGKLAIHSSDRQIPDIYFLSYTDELYWKM